jgi:hypothetical protein
MQLGTLCRNMVQSLSLETYSCSASQEIPRLLLNTNFRYSVYKSPSPVPILSQLNQLNNL